MIEFFASWKRRLFLVALLASFGGGVSYEIRRMRSTSGPTEGRVSLPEARVSPGVAPSGFPGLSRFSKERRRETLKGDTAQATKSQGAEQESIIFHKLAPLEEQNHEGHAERLPSFEPIVEASGAVRYATDRYSSRLDSDGIDFEIPMRLRGVGKPRIRFELETIQVGGKTLAQHERTLPVLSGDKSTVSYHRNAVEEQYELRKDGVEQSFVFPALPEGRGPIMIKGRLHTNLSPPHNGTLGKELSFTYQGLDLISISKAIAIDARGRRKDLTLAYVNGKMGMSVPAEWVAEAALPIVVDPLFKGSSNPRTESLAQALGANVLGPNPVSRKPEDVLKEKSDVFGYSCADYSVLLSPGSAEFSTAAWVPDLGHARVKYSFRSLTVGKTVLATGGARPPATRLTDRTIYYDHGEVEEQYILRKDALEQTFIVRSLPKELGDITVLGDLSTELDLPPDGSTGSALSLSYQGEEVISLSHAIAIDAAGNAQALNLSYANGQLRIVVPQRWVARAQLPITIDPLIGSVMSVSSSIEFRQVEQRGERIRLTDVAYNSADNEWLIIWTAQFAGNDYDVYGQRVSSSGELLGGPITISDSAGGDWELAASYASDVNRYLVAWRYSSSGSTSRGVIEGRVVNGDGTFYTSVFTIDDRNDELMVPSVAYDGVRWYVCYAKEDYRYVWGRFVTSSGVVNETADPFTSTRIETPPSVAFTNGAYLITVIDQSGDHTVIGRTMNTSGTFLTGEVQIHQEERLDQVDVSAGGGNFLVVWHRIDPTPERVQGRIVDTSLGFVTSTFTIGDVDKDAKDPIPRASYSSTSSKWLVAFTDADISNNKQVYVADVTAAGVVSGATAITSGPDDDIHPELAWNSIADEFLIAYMSRVGSDYDLKAHRWSMDETPPTIPGTPIVSPNPNAGTYTLTWTPSTDAGSGFSHYEIERSTDGGMNFSPRETHWLPTFTEYGIPEGEYVYRVLAVDNVGNTSAPSPNSATITVEMTDPLAPTGLAQYESNGTTSIAVGGLSKTSTVVLKGTVDDQGSLTTNVKLQVEVKVVDMEFDGTGLQESAFVSGGTLASVSVPLPRGASYHWRARTVDEAGNASAFVSFGGNPDTDVDFSTDLQIITIGALDWQAAEPSNSAKFILYRSGYTGSPVTVHLSLSGTASASDYTGFSSPITINAGLSYFEFFVYPVNDSLVEGSETLTATIVPDPSYEIGAPDSSTITIADNDAGTAPPTPGGFVGTPKGPDSIEWSWNDVSGETNYVLYYAGTSNVVVATAQDETSHLEAGLLENTGYTRQARAENGSSQSAATPFASAFTLVHDALPSDLSAVIADDTTVELTITPPFNATVLSTGVAIERSIDNATWVLIRDYSNVYSFVDTVPVAGAAYSYRITYRNQQAVSSGASPPLRVEMVPTLLSPGPDEAIPNVPPTFDWTDVPGKAPLTYDLQASTEAAFATPELNVTGITESTYTAPSTLSTAGPYYWRVRAVFEGANQGPWSLVSTFRIDSTAPTAPTLVSPADADSISSATPTLIWSPSTDASIVSYHLELDDDSDFSTPLVSAQQLSGTAYTVQIVLPEGTYHWRVRATDSLGIQGSFSAASSFTVDLTPPAVATLLAPADQSDLSTSVVAFDWTDVTDPGSVTYRLQVALDHTFVPPLALDKPGLIQSTHTETLDDGPYFWRVITSDAAGNESASSVFSFTVTPGATPSSPYIDVSVTRKTNDKTPEITGFSSEVTDIIIELFLDGGTSPIATTTVNGDGTWAVSPPSDLNDATYTFEARANKLGVFSELSNPAWVSVDTQVTPVTNVNVGGVDGHIHISWAASPDPDIVGYEVWWKLESQAGEDSPPYTRLSTDMVTGTFYCVDPGDDLERCFKIIAVDNTLQEAP